MEILDVRCPGRPQAVVEMSSSTVHMVSKVHLIIQSGTPQYFDILFSVDLRCTGDKHQQKRNS